ncbi:zinc ribbon domain-containing protein [Cupriavidus pinatubonensis]|uniref:zinc ribbon domain-containing protein n=1 Tax=Cupriavidus pinatubonensis TaxID=248026 RepID=UPI0029622F68|nr:zinc ribbon domain-containing protein [Cupriavidus pinatubonensis]
MSILEKLFGHHGGSHGRHHGTSHSNANYGYSGAPSPLAQNGGMNCSGCGAASTAGARFCQQCGMSLTPSSCSQCGASLPLGARFCAACGKAAK